MRSIFLRFFLLLSFAASLSAAMANDASSNPQITVNRASIVYITQAGDTLMSIAERYTMRRENWITIRTFNNIAADTAMAIGTPITIPADLLQDEPSAARVIALSGNITARSPVGSSLSLTLGAEITEGMQIDTANNSFLTLELPDQSRVSLPSNSRIRVVKLRMARYTKSPRTEILLLSGKIESKVAPLEQNKGRFEVRTPMAVAGVRGTQFRVGINANGMNTEVLSGKVEVKHPNGSNAQYVQAVQGNIASSKTITLPSNLLPAPQLASLPVRQGSNSAKFTLTSVSGARGYHVQIATDPEAKNILREGQSKNVELILDKLANGRYYARISAIDKLGLEGMSIIQAFTLDDIQPTASGAEPAAPTVETSESKQLALRWNGTPGQQFTVQIARDLTFSWLLYSSKTTVPEARFPRPPFGTYYARVQIHNADGSVGAYSAAQPFVVTDQWIIHDGSPVSTKDKAAR